MGEEMAKRRRKHRRATWSVSERCLVPPRRRIA
jgi:hypothetical protein